VDLLTPHRSQTTSGLATAEMQKRIVSCLLTLLDGGGGVEGGGGGVFVIATTSSVDDIDPAMRRPGRLDREVEFPVPSPEQRESILNKILERMQVSVLPDDSPSPALSTSCGGIREVAKRSHGMVGSDLLLLCKEAFISCLNRTLPSDGVTSSLASLNLNETSRPHNLIDPPVVGPCLTNGDLVTALSLVSPSGIREVAVEVPEVRWADIGGMEEVKQSLREVISSVEVYITSCGVLLYRLWSGLCFILFSSTLCR
jgi:SpoVK/Ycf46/Vps4 family AAA+-type ATPase